MKIVIEKITRGDRNNYYILFIVIYFSRGVEVIF